MKPTYETTFIIRQMSQHYYAVKKQENVTKLLQMSPQIFQIFTSIF